MTQRNLLARIRIAPKQFKGHYTIARRYVSAFRALRIAIAFTWIHITYETI